MNDYYYRAVIEKINNHKCSTEELIFLVNVFAGVVQNLAKTVAKGAYYNVEDFYNARANYVDKFSLKVKRKKVKGQEQWYGVFKDCHKKLKIIATAIDEW